MNPRVTGRFASWNVRAAAPFLVAWMAFSLAISLYYVERGMPVAESAPIGNLVIALVVCMLTPETNWKPWKRIAYPLVAYIGVSILGIIVMLFLHTPFVVLGAEDQLGAWGNTFAAVPFLLLGMGQSRLFRREAGIPRSRSSDARATPAQSNAPNERRPFSGLSEYERLHNILEQIMYESGCRGAHHIEEIIRPSMNAGTCRLSESTFRARCLVHSFALVWTGISLRVPVQEGKPLMNSVIDSLSDEIDIRFGFDWTRDQVEASVGHTWRQLVGVHGQSSGQGLLNMSHHLLRYYLDEEAIDLDLATQMVAVMYDIMQSGQIHLDAIAQPT